MKDFILENFQQIIKNTSPETKQKVIEMLDQFDAEQNSNDVGDIEKAANEYSINEHGITNEKQYERGYSYNGFISGAEWQVRNECAVNKITQKNKFSYARLIGEFIGMLKGFLMYDLPVDVKVNVENKIAELESISIEDICKKDFPDSFFIEF